MPLTRRTLAAVAVLAAILSPSAYLAWQLRDMPHLGFRWDDSIYFVCAKSLAEGKGYRILSLPGETYQTKYPPLFPAVLSGVWQLQPQFPENLPLAMLLVWLMTPVYVLSARALFSQLGFGWGTQWALCGLLALNPWVVLYSFSMMSELLFGSMVMACLMLAARAAREQPGTRTALGADLVVSVPKLKTHHWAGATLALKNLFGVVPGGVYGWPKNVLHWAGIDECIADLHSLFPRTFAIVDGIVGMEGNGPIQGKPKAAGVLVAGGDAAAVDATCCRIMRIDPEKIRYLELVSENGQTRQENVAQIGEAIRSVETPFALLPEFARVRL